MLPTITNEYPAARVPSDRSTLLSTTTTKKVYQVSYDLYVRVLFVVDSTSKTEKKHNPPPRPRQNHHLSHQGMMMVSRYQVPGIGESDDWWLVLVS